MKIIFALVCWISSQALASAELSKVIACHHAIYDKSKGTTEKLSFDPEAATPFVLFTAQRYYFVTSQGIFATEKTHPGKKIAYRLKDHNKDIEGEISIREDGKIASMGNRTSGATLVETSEMPDAKVLELFKDELTKRILTMADREQYNNKSPLVIESTRAALETCKLIESPPIQNAIKKIAPKFSKPAYKPAGSKNQESGRRR